MVVGNRGFFPHHLAAKGRETMLRALEDAGIRAVIPDVSTTSYGAIESLAEARLCAEVFKEHRDQIDGIIVTLPNFGDERAVANTIRFAGLDVPVLVHPFPDDPARMAIEQRREQFLWQDERLQQPAPVRNTLFSDNAAYVGPDERTLQVGLK